MKQIFTVFKSNLFINILIIYLHSLKQILWIQIFSSPFAAGLLAFYQTTNVKIYNSSINWSNTSNYLQIISTTT